MALAVGSTTEFAAKLSEAKKIATPAQSNSKDVNVFPAEVKMAAAYFGVSEEKAMSLYKDMKFMSKLKSLWFKMSDYICQLNNDKIITIVKNINSIDQKNIDTAEKALQKGYSIDTALKICKQYDSVQEYEKKEFGSLITTARNAQKVA